MIHDRTLNGSEDEYTSTAKNKSNKSNKDGSNTDEDVDENDEIEIPEDIIGSPLDLINRINKANHKSLEEIDVPKELRYTIVKPPNEPQVFLWEDSQDEKRILIFTTQSNLYIFLKHRDWYIDGTFDVSRVIPLVYSLLPNKDLLTYKKLYSMLMPYVKNKPKSINIDFELANITAIRQCFPETKIYGCFFHFTQNMWKHVQAEKKTDEYVLGKDYYYLFRALQSLAFVPLEHVNLVYEYIKKNFASYKVNLKYFETYYLGVKSRIERIPPRFPPELWNVSERIVDSLPRTNNSVEAWHKQFEGCCGKNPGVYKLIQNFREEQKLQELEFSKLRTGKFYSKATDREIRIYHMCTTFDKDDIKGFLSGMAQNLCE
ncbi:hypothetical protein BpHYR1_004371 [Brachionus plicatilis]|uniref:MULE transposase domain-containing protein n=1 Tax=Brachionus plicatilis TaxID=10195 RepID=A0A3M7Q5I5_BRAPC|nr:hypothetical protein BpHYR1_004371 [Brachionus plicatilis]